MDDHLANQSAWLRLFRRAKAGDGDALDRLLERYRRYLALLARLQLSRRLPGKIDARDVVQEVMLVAHCNLPLFRGCDERTFAAWLRQILANCLANAVRHYQGTKGRDPRLKWEIAVAVDASSRVLDNALASRHSTPSEQPGACKQGVQLADALAQLPEDQREVLVLRHLEELGFPEVTARLNMTVDRVKGLWTRGLDRLRRILGGAP